MKRRELIRSIALMGIGATILKPMSLSSVTNSKLPLKMAALGSTPCEMISYFVKNGPAVFDLYIMNFDRMKSCGFKTIDLIEDVDVFITSGYKYLLIVSPNESEMKELASGMINFFNRHNLEYHIIILGPFPFEGESHFKQTEKLKSESIHATSMRYIKMEEVIRKYGHMTFDNAFFSLYDELLTYVKQITD